MKHKITNYGIQKLMENFNDERSFYNDMSYHFTDALYMKLESVKETLLKKMEISDKARNRVIDEFVNDGKATKTPIEGQNAYHLQVKEEYIQDINTRIANILNTETTVDLDDFTLQEFEDVLGKKDTWKLSVPNRKFIDLLTASNKVNS